MFYFFSSTSFFSSLFWVFNLNIGTLDFTFLCENYIIFLYYEVCRLILRVINTVATVTFPLRLYYIVTARVAGKPAQ